MTAGSKRTIFDREPGIDFEEAIVEFRLTYAGPLYSTQRDPVCGQTDKRAPHKHEIREKLHPQLKRLWEVTPLLKRGHRKMVYGVFADNAPPPHDVDTLAKRHAMYGWNFVPLVTHDLSLLCGLDILFLRPDPPGGVVESGDIDNRLKTLFDALRVPVPGEDYASRRPEPEQTPFFCVLDNDRLITKMSVETDQMLEPVKGRFDQSAVRLVITVRVRPFEFDLGNIQFG